MTRRVVALLALLIAAAAPVKADTIKVVVPFAAGGPVDMLARLISADMQGRLKADMVVETAVAAAA
jgi:tripartite-type tricarboxylate transporter receptor subunit TctC